MVEVPIQMPPITSVQMSGSLETNHICGLYGFYEDYYAQEDYQISEEALKNPHLYSEAEMTYMRKAKKLAKKQQKLSEFKIFSMPTYLLLI